MQVNSAHLLAPASLSSSLTNKCAHRQYFSDHSEERRKPQKPFSNSPVATFTGPTKPELLKRFAKEKMTNPNDSIDGHMLPWANFYDFFIRASEPDAQYLTELNHSSGTRTEWTRAEWQDHVLSVAHWLQSKGIRRGDVIASLDRNSANILAIAFACWTSGICFTPLNPEETAERHRYIISDSEARLLLVGNEYRRYANTLWGETPSPASVESANFLSAERKSDSTDLSSLVGRDTKLDDVALRVYTSGTTGDPKAVELTARNLLIDSDALERGLQWPTDTRVLTVLPIHHVNGLIISSLLPWFAGYSTVLCDRYRTEHFWIDVKTESATVCSVVPSLLEFLIASKSRPEKGALREVLCGAGPLRTSTATTFEDEFEIPIRHLYGLSETTAVVTLIPRMDFQKRRYLYTNEVTPSIGRPLPHAEISIQKNDGTLVQAGQRGEICVRGAMVMKGYSGNSEATEAAFAHGWLRTGDEGFWKPDCDGNPYFYTTGRFKEIFIRGGVNISPNEIDSVLRSHPSVADAMAVAFGSRIYGEEVAAFIVKKEEVTEEEILHFCLSNLDWSTCPKVIIFGEKIPYTSTGKAQRNRLTDSLRSELSKYYEVQFRRPSSTVRP